MKPRAPHLLHVVNVASVTTLGFVLPFAEKAMEMGYEVVVCCSPSEHQDIIEKRGVKFAPIKIDRKILSLNHLISFLQLYRIIKREKIDIVHCHTPFAALLGRAAAAFAKVPIVIYHVHGTYFDEGGIANTLFWFTEKILGCWTSAVLTINRADTDDLVRCGLYSSEKIHFLPCGGGGVNLRIFDPTRVGEERNAKLKRELAIEPGEAVIGFIGRMVKVKGILDLLQAFAIIRADGTNAKLIMIGDVLKSERDQRTFAEFKDRAVKLGLQKDIIYLGFQRDIASFLGIIDVNVLPSYSEWFGMTIAEAAAMGKCSVATLTRGARDAIEDGVTGFLVPPGRPDLLAKSVLRLLNDTNLAAEMGAKARIKARAQFNQECLVNKVMALYQELYQKLLPVVPRL